jgi:RNA polymerase sigma-70 factor (ECF subfamily)
MNEAGYERVVLQTKNRLHSYAAWMLHDREEAKDVTQEALLRLWPRRGKVPEEAARPWLMRTLHHLCIDRLRRRSSRGKRDLEDLMVPPTDSNPGPEREAGATELRTAIGRALAGLSPRDRTVVLMREVQGMSYEEIADALGVPLGTLKAALHRARNRLRLALARAGVQP